MRVAGLKARKVHANWDIHACGEGELISGAHSPRLDTL